MRGRARVKAMDYLSWHWRNLSERALASASQGQPIGKLGTANQGQHLEELGLVVELPVQQHARGLLLALEWRT